MIILIGDIAFLKDMHCCSLLVFFAPLPLKQSPPLKATNTFSHVSRQASWKKVELSGVDLHMDHRDKSLPIFWQHSNVPYNI